VTEADPASGPAQAPSTGALPSKLVQVLRTVISSADTKNEKVVLHFSKPAKEDIVDGARNLDLNKLMQNVGGEQFDYGTFKAAYDTDPRVKTMVKNFNEKTVEPNTKKAASETPQGDSQTGGDAVSKMAKNAVDLKDL